MRQNRKRCGIAVFCRCGRGIGKTQPQIGRKSRLVAKYRHIAYRCARAIKPLPNAQSFEHGLGGRAQGQDALPILCCCVRGFQCRLRGWSPASMTGKRACAKAKAVAAVLPLPCTKCFFLFRSCCDCRLPLLFLAFACCFFAPCRAASA